MANPYFQFKQFTVYHDRCAMKVTTDACLFGAWVAAYLEKNSDARQSLLDIGTGTGLLSLMIAQKSPVTIEAIELDPPAAEQAAENAKASPWGNRIRMLEGDIRNHRPPHPYFHIVSNPPFYEKEIPSGTAGKQIAHHAGGLLWEELFSCIQQQLDAAGCFHLLLPFKRRKEMEKLFEKNGLYPEEIVVVRPTTSSAPSRLMIRGGKKPFPQINEFEENIAITGNQYTPFFQALLSEYYL